MIGSITLSSGLNVDVQSFAYQETYSGCGGSVWRFNESILERLRSGEDRWFGKRRRYVISPILESVDYGGKVGLVQMLPWGTFRVELQRLTPSSEGDDDFSYMNVIWLTSVALDRPLVQVLQQGLRDIPWKDEALPGSY